MHPTGLETQQWIFSPVPAGWELASSAGDAVALTAASDTTAGDLGFSFWPACF